MDRREFIKFITNIEDISCIKLKTKEEIKEIIDILKETKRLTIREISEVIGISKNIIYKL